jgi:hypothetical protein
VETYDDSISIRKHKRIARRTPIHGRPNNAKRFLCGCCGCGIHAIIAHMVPASEHLDGAALPIFHIGLKNPAIFLAWAS